MIVFQKSAFKLMRLTLKMMILALTLWVVSCNKTYNDRVEPETLSLGNGFYVLNEGNFTMGNATISFYQTDSGRMLHNVFFVRNNVPLGDVAQSMTFWKKNAFVVVNNSGIIWKIDAETAKIEGKMSGLPSPRFFYMIDDNKAVVSDFQERALRIVDPQNFDTKGYIHLGKTAEQMLLSNGKLFVANWSAFGQTTENNTVQVIDIEADKLVDSIVVTKEPNSMVIDKSHKLWILCSGGYLNEEFPALYRIHAGTLQVEKKFTFPEKNISPEQLTISPSGDTLFFLNSGIWRMPVDAAALPHVAFIPAGKRNFYRLSVDPHNSQIIATDAGNFQQKGFVFRFMPDGTQIDSLTAGVIPGFIGFNSNH